MTISQIRPARLRDVINKTQTEQQILEAVDLAESRRAGLLGFALRQKEGTKPWQWLLNSLTFPGRAHTLAQWNATPSHIAPIQKFLWADYSIAPGTCCRYRVHLVYGSAERPELGESLELAVTTDDGKPRGHGVVFNRAVAASQAFGRKFPELDALLSRPENKDLPIEKWPAAPRDWLQNGLLDRLLAFIAGAKDSTWALRTAVIFSLFNLSESHHILEIILLKVISLQFIGAFAIAMAH